MIKAIIIDDERSGRQVLQQLLNRFCKNVDVVAIAESAEDGKLAIKQHNPDVVFLDIEMPYESGFEMLNSFQTRDFHLVFVSAHQRYIEEAKQFSPIGFLLKPINLSELRTTIRLAEQGFE